MERSDTSQIGYGPTAKALHWLIVMLLVVQFTLAITMPHVGRDSQPAGLVGLHVSFGVLTLAVAVIRIIWRLGHKVPLLADNTPKWQRRLASITHAVL